MSLLAEFQKQLRNRLQLKGSKNLSDETCLLKFFKYYDIQNRGEISEGEFLKAMDKIGLQIFSKDEMLDVFHAYDQNGNGMLDYKEFSALICRPNQSSIATSSSYMTSQQSNTDYQQSSPSKSTFKQKNQSQINFSDQRTTMMESPNELLKKFKNIVKLRGIRGLISFQKIFKIIDIEGQGRVNIQEFKKALRDFKIENLQEQEIAKLFNIFDKQRNGYLSYKEFVKSIRGELNDFRRDVVERVFIILDKDNDGLVDIQDIRMVYNSKRHPEVMQGKRPEEAVKSEFFESFEDHHIFYTGLSTTRLPKISQDEFNEYYTNVGYCLDGDDNFSILMNNVWNISGNPLTFQALDQGWQANGGASGTQPSDLSANNMYRFMDERRPQTSAMLMQSYSSQPQIQPRGTQGAKESQDNPMTTSSNNQYYKQQQYSSQQSRQIQPSNPLKWEENKQQNNSPQSMAPSMRSERSVTSSVYHQEKIQLAKYQNILVERFKQKLLSKGIKGMIGLRKQFRLLDEDNQGSLSFSEFAKAIKSQQIFVDEIDIKNAFKAFDLNGNGQVEYDEFAKVLIGPMNKYRKGFVERAYNKLDLTQQGIIDLDYVISKFDGSRHPDLRLGKLTKQDFTSEFQQTFTAHHYMMHGYQALEKISMQEFIEYYAHVSACIESDASFSALIENVWSLDYRDNPDVLPYAGSKGQTVLAVDPHQRYIQDNFKGKSASGTTSSGAPYGVTQDQQNKTSYGKGGFSSKDSFYSEKLGEIELEEHDGLIYRLNDYYEIEEFLGKGGFGTVVQAYDKYKNQTIALKFKVYQNHALLGSERVPGVSLHKFIINQKKYQESNPLQDFHYWEQTCVLIMNQVFNAVDHIHKKNFIHRDIKPHNIVIDDKSLNLKVIDFGIGINADKDNEDQRCGTLIYEAPEQLFAQNQYNKSVDMWACGIVMYELLTLGDHPIHRKVEQLPIKNDKQVINYRKRGGSINSRDKYIAQMRTLIRVDVRYQLHKIGASEKCIHLLENLLSIAQSVRYKSFEVLQHPWLNKDKSHFPESPLQKKTKLIKSYQKLAKVFCTCLTLSILQKQKCNSSYNQLNDYKTSLYSENFENDTFENFDESNLQIEEVDEQTINNVRQEFTTKIDIKNKNSIESESSFERQLLLQKNLQNYQHYQSLIVLSPIKEVSNSSQKMSYENKGFIVNNLNTRMANQLSTARSLNREAESGTYQVELITVNNTIDSMMGGSSMIKTIKNKKHTSPEPFAYSQSMVSKQSTLAKVKKQQDKVRVIIQSSQAKQRKNSNTKSEDMEESKSPEFRTKDSIRLNPITQKPQQLNNVKVQKHLSKLVKSPKNEFNDQFKPGTAHSRQIQSVCQSLDLNKDSLNYPTLAKIMQSPQMRIQTEKQLLEKKYTQMKTQTVKQISDRCKSDDDGRNKLIDFVKRSPKALPKEIQQKLIGFSTKGFARKISPNSIGNSQERDTESNKFPLLTKKSSQLKLDSLKIIKDSLTQSSIEQKRYKSLEGVQATPVENQVLQNIKKEMKPVNINMEYNSFLQSASARKFLQEELRKIQDTALQTKQSLQIRGSQAKIQTTQGNHTNLMNKNSRLSKR